MDQRELITLQKNIRDLGDKMREQEVFCGNVNDFLRKAYRRPSLPATLPNAKKINHYRSAS